MKLTDKSLRFIKKEAQLLAKNGIDTVFMQRVKESDVLIGETCTVEYRLKLTLENKVGGVIWRLE